MTSTNPIVYVVIVSYRNEMDVIEALKHLFCSDYPSFRVIVCDNSVDAGRTLNALSKWANNWSQIDQNSANKVFSYPRSYLSPSLKLNDKDLLLVDTEENRGFSAGNNIGLRFALQQNDGHYFWVLNGDTAVTPNAMSKLVSYAENHKKTGMLGTTLVDFDNKNRIQAIGGAYWNNKTATASRYGEGLFLCDFETPPVPDKPLDLLVGASMFVSRNFLEKIGFLNEAYFLYCEEIDWAERARSTFEISVVPDAIVFHKHTTEQKSGLMWRRWFYFQRARLIYTYKYHPEFIFSVGLNVAQAVWRRLMFLTLKTTIPLLKNLLKINVFV